MTNYPDYIETAKKLLNQQAEISQLKKELHELHKARAKVTAVWLQTRGDRIFVMVEIDGQWYEIIDELRGDNETTISHCANLDSWNWEKIEPVNL